MDGELTRQQMDSARKALYKLSKIAEKLDRAECVGVECDELKARWKHATSFLQKINEVFGPEFPVKG